jgi:hypothetical protein
VKGIARAAGAALLSLLAACVAERPPAAPPATAQGANPTYPTLPDSLVLTAPGGVEVYFSGARVGTDSTGASCMERGIVLVRGGARTLVPLLMTGAPPTLVDDSTIRARIWLHCRPGNTYDVNLRTGAPTRVR